MKQIIRIIILGLLLINNNLSYAQLGEEGYPLSLHHNLSNSELSIIHLPSFNNDSIISKWDQCDSCLLHYGEDIDYEANFLEQASEVKVESESGKAYSVRRIKFISTNAKGLHIILQQFHLLKGDKLYFYSEKYPERILGAYTANNNGPTDKFVSNVIDDSSIVVELNTEWDKKDDIKRSLQLRGFIYLYKLRADFGDAKSCHTNVVCQPEHDDWCNETRSVVKLYIHTPEGWHTCSGGLLNNTNNNFDPLIMTAEHCTAYGDRFDEWFIYFNFQSPTCANQNGNDLMVMQGVDRVAVHDDGWGCPDLAMLRILEPIPLQYNVFYAGWSRRAWSSMPDNKHVAGIHHPVGDVKKITTGYATKPSYTLCIKAHWSHGTGTEFGSSGSPLFLEETHEYIASLSGWFDMKCDKNNIDYYSSLKKSWSTFLPFLAPNDEERLTLGGIDPISACQDSIDLNRIFFPGNDWQLKNQITIQAARHINLANNNIGTIISSSSTTHANLNNNSDYVIRAGNHITIFPGFVINRPKFGLNNGTQNRVSFQIQPCTANIPSCHINHSEAPPEGNNGNGERTLTKSLNNQLSVFPNPSEGEIRLVFGKSAFSYSITNMNEKVILKGKHSNKKPLTLNVANFANGVYYIKVSDSINFDVIPFVKN